jgi:predicted O-methyltransferase YrrM
VDSLDRYLEKYSAAGSEVDIELLDRLERETNLKVIQPKMLSGKVQGAFMALITKMIHPRKVLEIGTFTGYSALSIAAGLDENAEIHTVEIDDELEDIARSFFERSAHGHKIKLHVGSALVVVPQLIKAPSTETFDLIYIDGDKREYPDYYRMIMGDSSGQSMVRSGSVILADNVLWYGKVVDSENIKQTDPMSRGIMEFNRMVAEDTRVENVILPLRDGINFIRVK